MAAEFARQSSAFDGADLVVGRGEQDPPNGWAEGITPALFASAARAAVTALRTGDQTFAAFRGRWLAPAGV